MKRSPDFNTQQQLPDGLARDLIERYLAHGWKLCRIAPGSKGPTTVNWNTEPATDIADDDNIGLLHALSNTCAIDIDDYVMAKAWFAERGVDLPALGNASDAVQIASGRPGSAKLIYQTFVPMPSKKVMANGKTILEFRCASADGKSVQDVLPPSKHPSGSTYEWGGSGSWQALPVLPAALLTLWLDLLEEKPAERVERAEPVNLPELKSAMQRINPDCSYDDWFRIGRGWKEAGGDFESWNEWSSWSEGGKYPGEHQLRAKWNSFTPHPDPVGPGTIYKLAREHGWKPAPPDLSDMFAGVVLPENPLEIVRLFPQAMPAEDAAELCPPVLRNRALEVAASVGCDAIIPLMAGLSSVVGAADLRSRVLIRDGWDVPLATYNVAVNDSGGKKSPGAKPMFAPLRTIEAEDHDRYRVAMLMWEGQEALYSAAKKQYLTASASPVKAGTGSVPDLPSELLPEPKKLRIILEDVTIQAVARVLQGNLRGVLLFREELTGLLDQIFTGGESEEGYLILIQCGSHTVIRVGNGGQKNGVEVECPSFSAGLFGGVQTAVIRRHAAKMACSGLLQRFLVGMPTKHGVGTEGKISEASITEWERTIRAIFTMPAKVFKLSPEAYALIREVELKHEVITNALRMTGGHTFRIGSMEKMAGFIAAVAGQFHLCEIAPFPLRHDEPISADTMACAIALFDGYFIPNSIKFADLLDPEEGLDKWMADYIIQISDQKTVTHAALVNAAKRQLPGKSINEKREIVRQAMEVLANRGMIALLVDHLRYPVWAINPTLKDKYPEYRAKVIAARDAIYAGIAAKVESAGKVLKRKNSIR